MKTEVEETRMVGVRRRTAEPENDDGRRVAARFERRGDVFEAERFDAEERTETEALVTRDRSQQEDSHRSGDEGSTNVVGSVSCDHPSNRS